MLITYETLNALRYTNLFSTGELKRIAGSIQNYGLSLRELDKETAEITLEAAERNDITVYDGSYLGLATKLKTEFITADEELVRKLKGEYAKIVKHLSDV
jgi:predicted nucleic acid-binding protein